MDYNTDIDKQGMFETISNFPIQIADSIQISQIALKFLTIKQVNKFKSVTVFGMGGSAIGADLVRSYFKMMGISHELEIKICRNYDNSVLNIDNFFIASSYSGNTEETIYSLNNALKYTKNILVITTGGKIEEIAQKNDLPMIRIPKGFQPRAAIAYSFFTLLNFFLEFGNVPAEIITIIKADLEKCSDFATSKLKEYSNKSDNLAYNIASKIQGKIPVIYSNSEYMEAINLRFRGQIQENSKNLAFGNFLPEMNHNEINSFVNPKNSINNFIILLLKDATDNQRVTVRFEAIKEIYQSQGLDVIEIESKEKSALLRLVDLINLGDWISYHLAILNNEDPSPIPNIIKLKDILEASK